MSILIDEKLKQFRKLLLHSFSSDITQDVANNLQFKLRRIHQERSFVQENQFKYSSLTKREKQILKLVVNGKSNPEIANELIISRNTVEQHRKNINKKLEVAHLADLLKFGYAFNLI